MPNLRERAEHAKPVLEVLAYGLAAVWIAVQLLVRDCSGEFLPAGDVQIANVRRVTTPPGEQRIVFDVAFTTKRAAWRVEAAAATVRQLPEAPAVGKADHTDDDGCHGVLADLVSRFSRLEPDTPYRVSCITAPVVRDACYRLGVSFKGQRSLLLLGTLLSGAPTVASAETTSCPDDPKGDSK